MPTFSGVSSLFSNGEGDGFEDGDSFGDDDGAFGDYDADDEEDDEEEGLEDMSPAIVETYLERVKRAQQSGSDTKKRSYSTNLKR